MLAMATRHFLCIIIIIIIMVRTSFRIFTYFSVLCYRNFLTYNGCYRNSEYFLQRSVSLSTERCYQFPRSRSPHNVLHYPSIYTYLIGACVSEPHISDVNYKTRFFCQRTSCRIYGHKSVFAHYGITMPVCNHVR